VQPYRSGEDRENGRVERRLWCSLKQGCGGLRAHAWGAMRETGVFIVNFATGFLEVQEDSTHVRDGPSHRTDRPALASQDEISSQEGRTDAVRPSCVV